MLLPAALLIAQVAAASPSASAAPAAADARCLVVFGFIGSRGTPQQAEATSRGVM